MTKSALHTALAIASVFSIENDRPPWEDNIFGGKGKHKRPSSPGAKNRRKKRKIQKLARRKNRSK